MFRRRATAEEYTLISNHEVTGHLGILLTISGIRTGVPYISEALLAP